MKQTKKKKDPELRDTVEWYMYQLFRNYLNIPVIASPLDSGTSKPVDCRT